MMTRRWDYYNLGLCCLVIAGFLARWYMAQADPFLHIWDERFHALVARNMLEQPFVPMLRSHPVFPAAIDNWTQAHIWLHKQPLFLWQMALSMKVFGPGVFAARYPSVLMGTLMIPMIYSVVLSLSRNKKISLLTAGLFCFSNFHLELVAGIRSMDHNDLALEFYVLSSIWAWLKYESSGKWYWALLAGFCSGCAILTKWLIGLFVFLPWGINVLRNIRKQGRVKAICCFLGALLLCCLVFVPWQWYILQRFPAEAAYEYAFNKRHLTEALEGHGGTVFFYLERLPQLLGEGICFLLFPGAGLYLFDQNRNKPLTIPLLTGVLFVFIFLSLVASKTVSHLFFICPLLMMFMAYGIVYIIRLIKRPYLVLPLLAVIGVLSCKPEKITLDQSLRNQKRNGQVWDAGIYRLLRHRLPQTVTVVVNVPDCISLMFYNKGIMAYEMFSEEQMRELADRKVKIAAFRKGYVDVLPEYIVRYPYLYYLNDSLSAER